MRFPLWKEGSGKAGFKGGGGMELPIFFRFRYDSNFKFVNLGVSLKGCKESGECCRCCRRILCA